MKRSLVILAPVVLLFAFCKAQETTTTSSSTSTEATASTAAPPPSTTVAAPAPATTAAASAPTTGALASQQTNWANVTADVTEFRRKGNTLTAKVRFVNSASKESPAVEIHYDQVYLIDTAGGKKYQALKDEKGEYIAALNQGWSDRWFQHVQPGEPVTIWMKFPAPPAEVKTITLNIPKTPPFEDLTIQD